MPIDILCDDCSGTITFQMCSYFVSFFTEQDVPPATKGYVPKPVCLRPSFVVYYVNSFYGHAFLYTNYEAVATLSYSVYCSDFSDNQFIDYSCQGVVAGLAQLMWSQTDANYWVAHCIEYSFINIRRTQLLFNLLFAL